MRKRKIKKFIHVGKYAAEVEIELITEEQGWSPYISLEDAQKLDEIREALKTGNLEDAGKLAKVFTLTPLAM